MNGNHRRTITVYSETLKAFTIDHGNTRSLGPSLLVSYHDNDHYNSVRNKFQSPKPSRAIPIGNKNQGSSEIEKVTNSLSESFISSESDGIEVSIQKNVKRSAPCPCGSGLRYKKCCLAKQKQATRTERLKKANRQVEGEYLSQENENRSQDMFRVVTI